MDLHDTIVKQAETAKSASRRLAVLPSPIKNKALEAMACALEDGAALILEANAADLEAARAKKIKKSFLDRLMLDEGRIHSMAEGLRQTAALPDPVGEGEWETVRPNGIEIRRVKVPIGVIGIVYEARPNVTADAAALCMKSGNAVLLRGGSEALRSNRVISSLLAKAAYDAGIPEGALQFIDSDDREAVGEMMKLKGLLDVIIPRGGAGLIQRIVRESQVPVIETGAGICHTYVDEGADLDMAVRIAVNAKTSRPSVCNAMETLLVHEKEAKEFLPKVAAELRERKVELRGCERTRGVLSDIEAATEDDWSTEYDDLILSIRVVRDMDEAIEHINRYNTGHSETIVTRDIQRAHRFQREVDAAAVYVNASTRFTDGFEFGFGAEIGISTQKLHARGPMGLNELTSTKYLIYGEGQVR
ncbi:glutamate-5-semialdehyde dehydrogenase [Schwartzia succinivorans]|uniref:Gamma-glutamyl phosphate reductase n=1 Tax=Schwartzia succinivorans DSM 10502 TaxID=1123243 RepID=A0A1M4ZWA2_9FIRM|nr:glutamate-5-semialdehyde dehydrogenase [Schwartzia succinivorans]MBQ1918096.1 glutamate-5-semialdehyde dehydrogenase [Schwartzia sp. (in: firmicutes)]SHF22330.1 glutamate-5-semialdehyde dehydrogenase [Schwartzia succinivorans DSM 10502]